MQQLLELCRATADKQDKLDVENQHLRQLLTQRDTDSGETSETVKPPCAAKDTRPSDLIIGSSHASRLRRLVPGVQIISKSGGKIADAKATLHAQATDSVRNITVIS